MVPMGQNALVRRQVVVGTGNPNQASTVVSKDALPAALLVKGLVY